MPDLTPEETAKNYQKRITFLKKKVEKDTSFATDLASKQLFYARFLKELSSSDFQSDFQKVFPKKNDPQKKLLLILTNYILAAYYAANVPIGPENCNIPSDIMKHSLKIIDQFFRDKDIFKELSQNMQSKLKESADKAKEILNFSKEFPSLAQALAKAASLDVLESKQPEEQKKIETIKAPVVYQKNSNWAPILFSLGTATAIGLSAIVIDQMSYRNK